MMLLVIVSPEVGLEPMAFWVELNHFTNRTVRA